MKNTVKFHIILIIIAAMGLCLRLAVAREIFSNDLLSSSPPSYTDMHTYLQLSKQFYNGEFNQTFYFQPFYYAVFLPSIYLLLGEGVWGILIIQAILGSLTIWLTGISAASLRSRRTGIIAAILMMLSLMATFYTSYLLIATLKTFLIALMLFLSILAFKKDRWYYWGMLALVCSCLVLTRANTIIFMPLILIFSYIVRKRHTYTPPLSPISNFGPKLVPAIIIMLIFILPLIPFIYHNSSIEGKLTPPSTAGAKNLAIGNNPEACPAGLSYTQTANYWSEHAKEISVPTRIMVWFKNEPLAFTELTFRKLLIFWDAATIFDNISSFDKTRRSSKILTYLPFIPTSLFLIGFLSAILCFWRHIIKRQQLVFIVLLVLLYWLTTAAFIHLSRYRLVILPMLTIFTAMFIDKLIFNSHKFNKITRQILIFILVSAWVFGAYPLYRFSIEKHVIATILPNGVRVKLGEEDLLIDNGPRNMGSWKTFPIIPGNTITKKFAIESHEINKDAEFHLRLFCKDLKPFKININGKSFTSIPKQKNMVFRFPIKVPQDGKIAITPTILTPGTVFAFCDLQREYQRTEANGIPLKGELVCRLIVNE